MDKKKETKAEIEAAVKKRREREDTYNKQIQIARLKNDFVRSYFNGQYYLARCNMIVEQINSGDIIERIDEAPKSKNLFIAELSLMRMQAKMNLRQSHFLKSDLLKKFNVTEEEIKELLDSYISGKIMQQDYDEKYRKHNKAEFVNEKE